MRHLATASNAGLGRMAAAGAALALALTLAPGAGAEPARPSEVDVVGSGTLARPRVAVLAQPKVGAKRLTVLKEF
ncbi:MAG: hypothetical protein ACRDNY_00120, partial [Gaiellaceae bacterium]